MRENESTSFFKQICVRKRLESRICAKESSLSVLSFRHSDLAVIGTPKVPIWVNAPRYGSEVPCCCITNWTSEAFMKPSLLTSER